MQLPGQYYQIQAYPTCILYVSGGSKHLVEFTFPQFNLVSVILFLPIVQAPPLDAGSAAFALVSVSVQASIIQQPPIEPLQLQYKLVSVVSVLPMNAGIPGPENMSSSLALVSVLVLTPVTQSQSEPMSTALKLVSTA